MAKWWNSIQIRLIAISTLLLALVIGFFSFLNNRQFKSIIDDNNQRLQESITQGLKRAGVAQLQLLAESTRISLVQSDYATIQAIVRNLGREDPRITAALVVDKDGTILAHTNDKKVRNKISPALEKYLKKDKTYIEKEVPIGPYHSILFSSPVFLKQERLCTLILAFSLKELKAGFDQAQKLKKAISTTNLKNVIIFGLLSLLVGILFAIFQALNISRPMQALGQQASRIASGDLQARVDVKGVNEIRLLGKRFNHMARQVEILMSQIMKQATMVKEMEVASAVQSTLFPSDEVIVESDLRLAGYFKPASHCGGDWWSYYPLTDQKLLVLIGDATGHGVASAMITAAAKGAASTIISLQQSVDVTSLLAAMNAAIHDAAQGNFVMTCFAAIYDPTTRKLSFANAGHNFPYIYKANTQYLDALVARGNRLGDLSESRFECFEHQLEPGDTIIWYTDGVIECENIRGEEFGEKRFRDLLASYVHLSPEQAKQEIISAVYQFYGDVPQKDDITLVIGRVL